MEEIERADRELARSGAYKRSYGGGKEQPRAAWDFGGGGKKSPERNGYTPSTHMATP